MHSDDKASQKQFSIAIDDDILSEALASVEKHLGRPQRQADIDIGPLDLDALAAVEDELCIVIEEENPNDANTPNGGSGTTAAASVEARLRAMEAEEEAENLRGKLEGLAENRANVEQHLRSLSNRASQASEGQRLAETRSRNLKDALEKQQKDVSRLLERRKREKSDEYNRGRSDTLCAMAEVIDNLFLALSHNEANPAKLLEGVQMCLGQFQTNLGHVGVQTIVPEIGDPFDPALHEAIASQKAPDVKPGHIASVVSRGYQADGKLIQAARVCVASS